MSRSAKESFLARWSRRKREPAADKDEPSAAALSEGGEARNGVDPGKQGVKPESRAEQRRGSRRGSDERDSSQQGDDIASQLPPLEELGPDSDFKAFMDPRVDDDLRRAALKTLFRDPAFNVTDGLDVYAEDYTKLEKLTPAMVAALDYAKRNLFGDQQGQTGERSSDQADTDGTSTVANSDSEQNASVEAHTNLADTQTYDHGEDKPLSSGSKPDKLAAVPDGERKESDHGH